MSVSILKKRKNASKLHLVIFGSGDWEQTKFRLANQAKNTNWFETINCFSDKDSFLKKYKKPMTGRMAGYGWWKPAIILEIFKKIDENDIVLYLDAGFNILKENEKKLISYLEYVQKHSILAFSGKKGYDNANDITEKQWTKRDLLRHLGCDNEKYYSKQYAGGHFFIVKNDTGRKFLENFMKVFDDIHLANDEKSTIQEHPEFIEHRHCQSILSLLYKKTGLTGLVDESYSWLDEDGPSSPFMADRIADIHMDYLQWPNNAFTTEEIRRLVTDKNTYMSRRDKMKNKIHLVIFGSNNPSEDKRYDKTKFRLAKQAEHTGWFNTITLFDDKSPALQKYNKSFKEFMAGYGWWKPAIVLEVFKNIDKGDVVVYLDAGCNLHKSKEHIFYEYVEDALKNNICAFRSRPPDSIDYHERKWTKRDLLAYLNIDSEKYYHSQFAGTFFLVVNNEIGNSFINDFLEIYNHTNLVDRSPSVLPEHHDFEHNTECQSVLSALCKKYNVTGQLNYSLSWLEPNGPNSPWTADRITDMCMEFLDWTDDILTTEQIREKCYIKSTSYGARPDIYDDYKQALDKLGITPPQHLVEMNNYLKSRNQT